jgi:hypothetical protein
VAADTVVRDWKLAPMSLLRDLGKALVTAYPCQVSKIYYAALQYDRRDRGAFVRDACAGDEAAWGHNSGV